MSSANPTLSPGDPSIYSRKIPQDKIDPASYFHHQNAGGKPLCIDENQLSAKHKLEELADSKLLIDNHSHNRLELLNLIKVCRKEKNIWKLEGAYPNVLIPDFFVKDLHVATALIMAYAECGALQKAREIFHELPVQDVVSWNALISGYAKNGLPYDAVSCFRKMQDAGIYPNRTTYIHVLKVAGILKSLETGEVVDAAIRMDGLLQKDIVLGNTLLSMYSKCGAMERAQKVFDELPVRDVVSWSALIAGYVQNGFANDALKCFERMCSAGVCPDVVTYICVLKACGIMKAQNIGEAIFAEVQKQGFLQKNILLGTALMDMYFKCGSLGKAQAVFEQLPVQDVVSWNALITGYAQTGLGHEALKCFRQMQDMGVQPNVVTYLCSLKACGIAGCVELGKEIDADVRKQGLLQCNVVLGNALVDMYSKCNAMDRAQEMFEQLPMKNVVAWSALITGYVRNGLNIEALKCFTQMQDAGVYPDVVTYIIVLKACGTLGHLDIGEDIDAAVRKQGLLQKNVLLGSALIDMYSKCGVLEKAQDVFDQLPVQDVVVWGVLISGYTQNGRTSEALECFNQMKAAGISPDPVTCVSVLKACGISRCLNIGKDIDAEVRRQGLLKQDVILSSALVDMYSKCGTLDKALEVFEQLPVKDVVSWNTLIAGYAKNGHGKECLECFKQMQDAGVCPNAVTYSCVLEACGIVKFLDVGVDVYGAIRKQGLLQKDVVLGNALVDMYSKCGALEKAREAFQQLPIQNVGSWNALLSGYIQHQHGEEALNCFREMQRAGVCPDAVTYVFILSACGIVGSLESGQYVHSCICKQGILDKDVVLHNALLDMYAKCGAWRMAQEVFDRIPTQSVVSWSSLMACYAHLGQADTVLLLYGRMKTKAVVPDSIAFIVLLTACCHGGLVKEAEKLLDEMNAVYHLVPDMEHYTCMIDSYGRAAHFDKAKTLLDKVADSNHLPLLLCILGSCREWRNVKLARWAFERIIRLDQKCAAAYAFMVHMY